MKKLSLIIFALSLTGCATFGASADSGKAVANGFKILRNGICARPIEIRSILQNEIDAAGVSGIDIALMCSEIK